MVRPLPGGRVSTPAPPVTEAAFAFPPARVQSPPMSAVPQERVASRSKESETITSPRLTSTSAVASEVAPKESVTVRVTV